MRVFKYYFLSILIIIPSVASAFSTETTHPAITGQGVDFYNNFSEIKITDEQKTWIMKGSVDEDNNIRSLYHFYDPVHNRGVKGYRSAKSWVEYSGNNYSWQKAKEAYIKGDEKAAYIALGHVIHLIQDMFVPDHTRNDAHLPYDESVFEVWAEENKNKETLKNLSVDMLSAGFIPKDFFSLDEYFDFSATYANGNFFSKDTIEDDYYHDPLVLEYKGDFGYGDDILYLDSHILLKRIFDRKGLESKVIFDKADASIVSDYFSRLSKQAIIVQAGVMELFFKEAEELRLENQNKKQEQGKINLFIQKIKDDLNGGFKLLIQSSGTNNLATVFDSFGNTSQEQMISVSIDKKGETSQITGLSDNGSDPGQSQPLEPQNISDQELEDMVGVSKEDLLKELLAFIENTGPEGNTENNPRQFTFSMSGGGARIIQDDPEESNQEAHRITLISPTVFSEYFSTSSIEFSGTSTPYSIISQSHSNSTTTVDENGEWSIVENFSEGTSTVFFSSSHDGNIATTSEYLIKVHFLPQAPTLKNTACNLSFVKDNCVLSTTTFSLSWDSESTSTNLYNVSFQGINSTTTATSSEYVSLAEGKHKVDINVIDDMGFYSATTSLNFEIIPHPVVVNEISWSGEASSTDQWIELFNRTNYVIDVSSWFLYSGSSTLNINLVNQIPSKGYYLIESKDLTDKDELIDSPVKDIVADLWISFGGGLKKTGEELTVSYEKENLGTTTTLVSDHFAYCKDWCGQGGGTKHLSLERWDAALSSDWTNDSGNLNLGSNLEIIRNGKNKNGADINGTPKKKNSISYRPVNGDYYYGDLTLTKENGPYLIFGSVFFDGDGNTLTIEPGTILKFANDSWGKSHITTFDSVLINGTEDSKVLFTSIYDTSVGEDLVIAGLSSTTEVVRVGGLYVFDQPKTSIVKGVVFQNMNESVMFSGNPVNIKDSTFINSEDLYLDENNVTMTKVVFKDMRSMPILAFGSTDKQSTLKVEDIIIEGEKNEDDRFAMLVYDYDLDLDGLEVNNGQSEDGLIIRNGKTNLNNIKIKDTEIALNITGGEHKIYNSNFIGDDVSKVGILASEGEYLLDNITIDGYNKGLIVNSYATMKVSSSSISGNLLSALGVLVDEANVEMEEMRIEGFGKGVLISGGAAKISNSILTENNIGIEAGDYFIDLKLFNNSIFGNFEYGIYNNSSENTIDAKNNWWGDALGPNVGSEDYLGIGDYISGLVDYSDYLILDPFFL